MKCLRQRDVHGVSAPRTTNIHIFVELGIKVNEVLLMQILLPDIRHMSEFYVFQQDNKTVTQLIC